MAKKRSGKQKKITLLRSRKTRAINTIKKLNAENLADRTKARLLASKIMMYNTQLNELDANVKRKEIVSDTESTETELGHAWEVGSIIDYLQDLNPDKLNSINLRMQPHKLVDLVYSFVYVMTSKEVLYLSFNEDENMGNLFLIYES